MVPAYSDQSLVSLRSAPSSPVVPTYQEIWVRMLLLSHTFGVAVVLHSCLHKVLIDGRQNCKAGIEACVEEHLVGLDLEGTAIAVS